MVDFFRSCTPIVKVKQNDYAERLTFALNTADDRVYVWDARIMLGKRYPLDRPGVGITTLTDGDTICSHSTDEPGKPCKNPRTAIEARAERPKGYVRSHMIEQLKLGRTFHNRPTTILAAGKEGSVDVDEDSLPEYSWELPLDNVGFEVERATDVRYGYIQVYCKGYNKPT
ncbi:reverse transcriptase [Phytophthora megakarya]|uniref:Reverse transcriptase n=1 Tax=Phytophthora megakarya TaxID=4795 RepID=A0A225W8T9_9STRA|nr:reverse transcriptase [Phytophthora megakarya]